MSAKKKYVVRSAEDDELFPLAIWASYKMPGLRSDKARGEVYQLPMRFMALASNLGSAEDDGAYCLKERWRSMVP